MKKNININSLKNLPQYKDKTEEEIIELIEERELEKKLNASRTLESRIKEKLDEFEKDYDISDLKYNDTEALRSMMIALINLEDLDQEAFDLVAEGIDHSNLNLLDKVSSMSSKLRSDISKIQDDLKISRKIRKSNKEESVLLYIEGLKEKAVEFAEAKMTWVFCEECNMLLSTIWLLYPGEKENTLSLKCNRPLQDGSICGHVTRIRLSELEEEKTNKPDAMPEAIN